MSSAVAAAFAVAVAFVLPLALLIESMRQRSHVVLLSPTYLYPSSPPAQTLFGFKQEDLNANVMLAQRPGPPSCTHIHIYICIHLPIIHSERVRTRERGREGEGDLAQVEGIKGKAS